MDQNKIKGSRLLKNSSFMHKPLCVYLRLRNPRKYPQPLATFPMLCYRMAIVTQNDGRLMPKPPDADHADAQSTATMLAPMI